MHTDSSCAPSLDFGNGNVENITSYHDCIGSDINGNYKSQAKAALRAPGNTARHYGEGISRGVYRLRWTVVKRVLSGWAEEASSGVSSRVNSAFQGYDVCEMGYKVTDLIPSVSLPTMRQIGQKLDSLSDRLQALLERAPLETKFKDEGLQGMQWIFAVKMGEKVRRSLVKQGICKPWQVMPSRENLQWQGELNQALTQLFMLSDKEFSFGQLTGMEPVWIADRNAKVWRLEIDTLFVDLVKRGEEVADTQKHLQTGFALPESAGSVSIKDYCRGTRTVEDEWEMFE
ncbi:hypothetical protein K458DRAFT_312003 [Lentithecium fluviatile CBS 122367]|uniref:Uncharacterized protein n=1 Tax=Lentithecium fluviatile CBS 122367 TaxID=1168545 RepID=A0A6G1IQG2_9PLEO|nr:hypothetical protein K458DRAFT_312003 [Lentithecium fluviatile CBS 122367]